MQENKRKPFQFVGRFSKVKSLLCYLAGIPSIKMLFSGPGLNPFGVTLFVTFSFLSFLFILHLPTSIDHLANNIKQYFFSSLLKLSNTHHILSPMMRFTSIANIIFKILPTKYIAYYVCNKGAVRLDY